MLHTMNSTDVTARNLAAQQAAADEAVSFRNSVQRCIAQAKPYADTLRLRCLSDYEVGVAIYCANLPVGVCETDDEATGWWAARNDTVRPPVRHTEDIYTRHGVTYAERSL